MARFQLRADVTAVKRPRRGGRFKFDPRQICGSECPAANEFAWYDSIGASTGRIDWNDILRE